MLVDSSRASPKTLTAAFADGNNIVICTVDYIPGQSYTHLASPCKIREDSLIHFSLALEAFFWNCLALPKCTRPIFLEGSRTARVPSLDSENGINSHYSSKPDDKTLPAYVQYLLSGTTKRPLKIPLIYSFFR